MNPIFIDIDKSQRDKNTLCNSEIVFFLRSISYALQTAEKKEVERFCHSVKFLKKEKQNIFTEKVSQQKDFALIDLFTDLYNIYAPRVNYFNEIKAIYIAMMRGDSVTVKVFEGSEKEILTSVFRSQFFKEGSDSYKTPIGGYNILSEKIPLIIQKSLKLGLTVPERILLTNKKPWEINIIDIAQIWKGYQYAYGDGIEGLFFSFGIPYSYEIEANLRNLVEIAQQIKNINPNLW